MKKILFSFSLFVSFLLHAQKQNVMTALERNVPFDDAWLFTKDSVVGAEQTSFDDGAWTKVDLPHDWSIEDLPNQTPGHVVGPFDKNSPGFISTGFTIGGTAWYRKKFVTQKREEGKNVSLHFDGVYMNADVWLNGHLLGSHAYGYTPFYFNLSPHLKPPGQENVLAVRVRNEGKNSRWYSGSGIYRHVWLNITHPVHIVPWGVFVTTPVVEEGSAVVKVAISIANRLETESAVSVVTTILSPEGKTIGQVGKSVKLERNASQTDSQTIRIGNPALWSVETPRLYKAVTKVVAGGKTLDRVETTFGIRTIRFDAANGFTLNGKRVLLKGGCIHHDNGPLGAAAIDRAEERKIEILKKNGFNAVRSSHNPPSQALLNACDRLGMLVINEAFDMWERPKNPQDYHLYFKDKWKEDLRALILRDRNHPSVIIWSIGNEIPERADSSGLRITQQLVNEVRNLDPTRPVTEAICQFWETENRGKQWAATEPVFALLDIGGYNYLWQRYEEDHQQFPHRVMLGTESYAREALENWNMVEKHPYVIGDFVWTAMDYLGEASIGHAYLDTVRQRKPILGWPWFNAWCVDIDLIGQKKPQSYYRDVVWRQRPIAMAVHRPIPSGMIENVSDWGWPDELQSWTWPGAEGVPLQVRVFSRAPMVRLFLNGKVVGEQKIADTSITAVFEVPYSPGTLKAVNVYGDKEKEGVTIKTAGAPNRIQLSADRSSIKASRNDLAYITVEIIDKNNQVVPNAEVPVQFSISGAGELLAVGNANPKEPASFRKAAHKTFRGRCLLVIRPNKNPGIIVVRATAAGFPDAVIKINTYLP